MALWTPALIDTALWLDAADASTLTLVDGAVSQWNDKSVHVRHATQSTKALRPSLGSIGSQSAPDFTARVMLVPEVSGAALAYFFVCRSDTGVNIALAGAANNSFLPLATSATTNNSEFVRINGVANPSGVTVFTNGSEVVSPTRTTQYAALRPVVGVLYALQNTPPVSATLEIGRGGGSTSWYFGGPIGEIVVIENTLLAANKEKIEGYLAHKWGLEADLPADHPYKLAAPTINSISGTVTDDAGQPAARTVRVYDRATGALLGTATSDAVTGAYEFTLSSTDEVQRIVLDDEGGTLYNDILDRVVPE